MSGPPSVAAEAALERAIDAFQRGQPVLIHDFDDREGETDLVYPAAAVDPVDVARLRNDAGGLVCVALSAAVADAYDLPFLQNVLDHPAAENHELSYDDRSSFSLPVNHRETDTGITDVDRSRTIRGLAEVATAVVEAPEDARPGPDAFAAEFRTPGHVHVLAAADGLLDERRGHTELGIALADETELPPAVVVCEMLDDRTGEALPPADARAYADRHDLAYVEGAWIVEAFG